MWAVSWARGLGERGFAPGSSCSLHTPPPSAPSRSHAPPPNVCPCSGIFSSPEDPIICKLSLALP